MATVRELWPGCHRCLNPTHDGPCQPATVAGGRTIIQGLPDPVLADYELRAETAMTEALQQVMDTIADRIGNIQTAAGRLVWDGCRHGLHDRHVGPCP